MASLLQTDLKRYGTVLPSCPRNEAGTDSRVITAFSSLSSSFSQYTATSSSPSVPVTSAILNSLVSPDEINEIDDELTRTSSFLSVNDDDTPEVSDIEDDADICGLNLSDPDPDPNSLSNPNFQSTSSSMERTNSSIDFERMRRRIIKTTNEMDTTIDHSDDDSTTSTSSVNSDVEDDTVNDAFSPQAVDPQMCQRHFPKREGRATVKARRKIPPQPSPTQCSSQQDNLSSSTTFGPIISSSPSSIRLNHPSYSHPQPQRTSSSVTYPIHANNDARALGIEASLSPTQLSSIGNTSLEIQPISQPVGMLISLTSLSSPAINRTSLSVASPIHANNDARALGIGTSLSPTQLSSIENTSAEIQPISQSVGVLVSLTSLPPATTSKAN